MARMIKLDLGAGPKPPKGYTPLGFDYGSEIYPLAGYADGSVDEIRASHVLEHFPHKDIRNILAHWAVKLKPGGVLKIAVPDFDLIAKRYLDGNTDPTEEWIMGGQTDPRDYHKALFNAQTLIDYLRHAGLTDITRWDADSADCSASPISLNLRAVRPVLIFPAEHKTSAIMSVPRYGPLNNLKLAHQFHLLGIPLMPFAGAYFGQCMERGMDAMIADGNKYFYTCDYDTVAYAQQIQTIFRLMILHPEADAICALQMARGWASPLLTMDLPEGVTHDNVPREVLDRDLVKLKTGHFGLTLFRAESMQNFPKPWFLGTPAPDGSWGDGRVDDDIHFWRAWAAAGKTLYCAMRAPVGHQEEIAIWPGRNLLPVYQRVAEFWTDGPPKDAWK